MSNRQKGTTERHGRGNVKLKSGFKPLNTGAEAGSEMRRQLEYEVLCERRSGSGNITTSLHQSEVRLLWSPYSKRKTGSHKVNSSAFVANGRICSEDTLLISTQGT